MLLPGDPRVRALLCLLADPARELPGGPRAWEALAALELLVALDVTDTPTTRLAHFVLPGRHAWERSDLHLHDTAILPYRCTQATEALVSPVGEARDEADVLADLFRHVGPALRSDFGPVARVRGGRLVSGDLDEWMGAQLANGAPSRAQVRISPHGWFGGEVDRATWNIDTPSGRIELLPEPVAAAVSRLVPPSFGPGQDRWLLTGAARDRAVRPYDRPPGPDPGVTLHPGAGFAEGATVRVRTAFGSVVAVVHLDDGLRADVVDLPAGYVTPVAELIPADALDPLCGTAPWNGLGCVVERT
jgi:anaerobic selenocysteine-containing dehydrogenase